MLTVQIIGISEQITMETCGKLDGQLHGLSSTMAPSLSFAIRVP